MRSLLLLLVIFVSQIIQGNGFVAGTLVKTPQGYIPIEEIEIGQEICCYDVPYARQTISKVTHIHCWDVPTYAYITLRLPNPAQRAAMLRIADASRRGDRDAYMQARAEVCAHPNYSAEYIACGKNHLFFYQDPRKRKFGESKWVAAYLLHKLTNIVDPERFPYEPWITQQDGSEFMDVHIIEEPTYLFDLTVDKYHTYYVTQHDILVHNSAALAAAGAECVGILCASTYEIVAGVTATTGAAYILKYEAAVQVASSTAITVTAPTAVVTTGGVAATTAATTQIAAAETSVGATVAGSAGIAKAAAIGGAVIAGAAATAYTVGCLMPDRDEPVIFDAEQAAALQDWFTRAWNKITKEVRRIPDHCKDFADYINRKQKAKKKEGTYITRTSVATGGGCGDFPWKPDDEEEFVYGVSNKPATPKNLPGGEFKEYIYNNKGVKKGVIVVDRFGNEIRITSGQHPIEAAGRKSAAAPYEIASKAYKRSIQVSENVRIAPYPGNCNKVIEFRMTLRQGKIIEMHAYEHNQIEIAEQFGDVLKIMKLCSPKGKIELLLNKWPW